jgi:hypothetical protein
MKTISEPKDRNFQVKTHPARLANENQPVSHGTTTTPSCALHTKFFHQTQYKYQNDNGNRRRRLLQRTSRPALIIFPTPLHTQHPRNFRVITTTTLTLAEKRMDNYYYATLLGLQRQQMNQSSPLTRNYNNWKPR